jgi:hypothetical protein
MEDDVEQIRKMYFDGCKYIRGDGKYQSMYEFFVEYQSNAHFNWLYQIYNMWHKHRVFMTWNSMVERGQEVGVKKKFATDVANSVYTGCKSFFYITNSLLVSKDRLIDLCLNDSMYNSVCRQVIGPLTEFHNQLDGFMNDLLWSIRDEYVHAMHGNGGKRLTVQDIESLEFELEENLVAHDDAMTCMLDDEVDKDIKEHVKEKRQKRKSLPSVFHLDNVDKEPSPISISASPSTKERLTSFFHRISPRGKR